MQAFGSQRPQKIVYGIILIIVAMFVISAQDVVFKFFSNRFSLWQIFTLRGLLAIPMLVALVFIKGEPRSTLSAAIGQWPLLRSVFITVTFLAFYAAIPFLSLSVLGAANYMAPIFVTLLSAYFVSESVSSRAWFGVFLGFAGVILLLQPGSDAFSYWTLLPLVGAAFYALSHIIVRTRCQNVPLLAMALSLNIVMMMAGLTVSLVLLMWPPIGSLSESTPYIFGPWLSIGFNEWLVLLLLALFTIAAGMLLAGAYQAAPPSTIATFEYIYLVFVVMWDVLFFAVYPTGVSIIGMILIVVAGLLVLRTRP